MLPHALSSGLCSLVEAQDRLVKTVICEFSPDAQLLKTEFANSVICSLKRLTYKQAYAFLKGDDNAQLRAMPAPPPHQTGSPGRPLSELKDDELQLIRQMIGDFWKIGKILRAERFRAGSLDLDMKEIKIYCDKDGWADRTEIVTHDESHQLIEEFMLLANECVAKSLDKASIPHVCRVHDDPDPEKLAALREELAGDGFKVGDLTHRSEMVKLLSDLKTREDGYTIRIQLLRSLKQACYRPSPYRNATQSGVSQIAYHFGTPMIITNVGGLSELVPHGEAGWVCEPTSESLAAALVSMYEPNRLDHIRNSLKELKRQFSWTSMVKALEEVTS